MIVSFARGAAAGYAAGYADGHARGWFAGRRGRFAPRLRVTSMASALVCTVAATAFAQKTVADGNTASDTGRVAAVLSTPVSITLQGVTLKRAVGMVGAAASLRIQYQASLLDAVTAPVTMSVTRVPVGDVLVRMLAGTGMHIVPMAPDIILIQPAGRLVAVRMADGGVSGVVTDASTKRPVADAVVLVDNVNRHIRTSTTGAFSVPGLSAGKHTITVRRLGYKVATTTVTVSDNATETVAIALSSSASVLDEVVTTATGDQRRVEVGNAIGTIKADSVVKTTLIRNVSDLLQARVPGVVVSNTSGLVGSPSKIRIRGVNSISLNNDPIIILDGVRLNTQTTTAPNQTNLGSPNLLPQGPGQTGQLAPSRLDDIDPNTIESIDVLRGPSASSLYGTDAANGVIVIKTKRGQPGQWRLTLSGDQQWSVVPGDFPDQWFGWGTSYDQNILTTGCLLTAAYTSVTGGSCHQDSVTHFNLQNHPEMQTIGTGTAQTLSASLSGGTAQLQQFFSARGVTNTGMAKMSDIQQRIIQQFWSTPVPSWMVHPNTEQDIDGSSRTTFNPTPVMDLSLSAAGMYRSVLNGGSGVAVASAFRGTGIYDTLGFLPSERQKTEVTTAAKHGNLALDGHYRPLTWLSFSSTLGGDYNLRNDLADQRSQDCAPSLQLGIPYGPTQCPSSHSTLQDQTFVTTANGEAQLSFSPWSWLSLRTSLGEQYTNTRFYDLQISSNCNLAFGTQLFTPSPVCDNSYGTIEMYTVNEARDQAATAGIYLEESVGIFGTYTSFGVRRDVASAFGSETNKTPPNYPKINLSYPLSEKSFFPKQQYVTSLRLRLAYGQSGNQASQLGVLNNYYQQQYSTGTTGGLSTVYLTNLGNADLKPERGTEWEGGFDVSFLENERLHAELTLYRKFTRDAITNVTLPPSYGVATLSEYVNLGDVQNRGVELLASARILDSRPIAWSVTMNYSSNSNTLVHKAPGLNAYGPLGSQFREGYPVFGYWGLPVKSYADLNGDGILARDEITFGNQVFMGAPYPKNEIVYSTNVALFNGALQMNASFDQVTDKTTVFDANGGIFYTRGAVDPTSPLGEQAAWIQSTVNNGFYGSSSSVRFNELSLTYNVPSSIAERWLRVRSASVTFAGRNLALWTTYIGKDPNVDTSASLTEVSADDGTAIPQPRNFALRFTLGL